MSVITSRQNPLVKKIQKIAGDAKERKESGLFLGDGTKLLADALRSGVGLVSVVTVEKTGLPPLPENTPVFSVPDSIMRLISPTKTPQGVLFLAKQPAPLAFPPQQGRFLLLEHLQDPGNIGSILRSAEAFGFAGVLLHRSADPFSPKSLRGGMGAQFRLPLCEIAALDDLRGSPLPLWTAGLDGVPLQSLPPTENVIVALGNEGGGLSDTIRARADVRFTIPMTGRAESLGVAAAAAIACYQLTCS